jgi:hypothetical protein
LVRGGGYTGLRERGWGSPNSDEGTYTVVLFIYKYFVSWTIRLKVLMTAIRKSIVISGVRAAASKGAGVLSFTTKKGNYFLMRLLVHNATVLRYFTEFFQEPVSTFYLFIELSAFSVFSITGYHDDR